jgi:hypothetical protein
VPKSSVVELYLHTPYILLNVHPLLGNVLVNEFPRRQNLGRESVARLRNNRGAVSYMSSAPRLELVAEQ